MSLLLEMMGGSIMAETGNCLCGDCSEAIDELSELREGMSKWLTPGLVTRRADKPRQRTGALRDLHPSSRP